MVYLDKVKTNIYLDRALMSEVRYRAKAAGMPLTHFITLLLTRALALPAVEYGP